MPNAGVLRCRQIDVLADQGQIFGGAKVRGHHRQLLARLDPCAARGRCDRAADLIDLVKAGLAGAGGLAVADAGHAARVAGCEAGFAFFVRVLRATVVLRCDDGKVAGGSQRHVLDADDATRAHRQVIVRCCRGPFTFKKRIAFQFLAVRIFFA